MASHVSCAGPGHNLEALGPIRPVMNACETSWHVEHVTAPPAPPAPPPPPGPPSPPAPPAVALEVVVDDVVVASPPSPPGAPASAQPFAPGSSSHTLDQSVPWNRSAEHAPT